jgi:hypothetical protein
VNLVETVKAHGPIKRAALARRLGVTERRLRAMVNAANDAGQPVVFTGQGFIYAKRREDVTAWARNQSAAARAILQKVAGVTKSDVEGVVRGLFA